MKRIMIFLILILCGMAGFYVSTGYSHNNSAPNFECANCHQGEVAPDMIKIQGLPKTYVPGKAYKLTLTVTSKMKSEGEVQGGFAVEASAGELLVTDKKHTQRSNGLLTHTKEGSLLRKWTFTWKAPKEKVEEITISVMAVAANGDFSPNGDMVGFASYAIKAGK